MSEHSREIRASLMDLPRLEQQFEMQAENGYMVTRISGFWGSGNAVYEDITGGPYHFCVRPFEKRDFPEFKAAFESVGWTLCFAHGSLAVFYSREPQRPPVPAWGQEKLRDLLLKQVRREERNLLLKLQISVMIFLLLYIFISPLAGKDLSLLNTAVLAAVYLIFSTSFCLGRWLRYLQTVRCLKAGGNSPEQIPFWNKSAEMSLGIGSISLAAIYFCCRRGDLECLLTAVVCLLLCAADIAVCKVWHKNAGPHRRSFIPWLLIPVEVVLLFVMLLG